MSKFSVVLRPLALALCLLATFSIQSRAAEKVTVFAAASMTDVLKEIGEAFQKEDGSEVIFSFAGTGTIARQLESGAPADVFVSADQKWMKYVVDRDAVDKASVGPIATNGLVLVGPKGSAPLELTADDLEKRLADGRLAVADTETVPAGRYAKEALTNLGLWDTVSTKLAPMDNVRVALATVARGETPLGIVYASDATVEPDVQILARFPADSHGAIIYPAALTPKAGDHAKRFLAFLSSPKAMKLFDKYGFGPAPVK